MSEAQNISKVLNQLKGFKHKFYLDKLVKGVLLGSAIILAVFLTISFTEYTFRLNSPSRLFLLLIFLFACITISIKLIGYPLYKILFINKQISDEEAAKIIGKYYTKIDDKLLNIIQLHGTDKDNSLIRASINQNARFIANYNFKESVSIKKGTRKIAPYLIGAIIILFFVRLSSPDIIKDGSYRVLRYQENFTPPAPFNFLLVAPQLNGYKGDTFDVELRIEGNSLPDKVYISKQGNKFLMDKIARNLYKYSFNQVQVDIPFHFEASTYQSSAYLIKVSDRPLIKDMLIEADYPEYIKISDEKFFNASNLNIPAGTKLKWTLNTQSANKVSVLMQQDNGISTDDLAGANDLYTYSKAAIQDFKYQFNIENKQKQQEQSGQQKITVIPDNHPEIDLQPIVDSTYFSTIIIEGEIGDDYGFTTLKLFYSTSKSDNKNRQFISVNIPFTKDVNSQKYFFDWSIDSVFKDTNDQLTYYTEVWDNDQLQGPKSSQSVLFQLKYPTEETISTSISKSSQQTDNQFVKSISTAKDLENQLTKLDEILKTKQALSFDDKQLIKAILEQSEELNNKLQRIQDQLIENANKREKFSDPNEQLLEKNKELLERVGEMQSNKEKELMEKINELLQKTDKSDELQESASELNKKQKNKLKELERLMQLFQRLEIEYALSETNRDLKKLAKEQKNLASDSAKNTDTVLDEQEEINNAFEKVKEKLDDLKDKNQQLDRPSAIKDTKSLENEIDQSQQESIQNLQNGEDAKESQQRSGEKMSQMSETMQQMQAGMQGEQLKENVDNLRDIVDNLLKLSFRQEDIMSSLRQINASDPRFLILSERQLNLKDDGKIIEDSLTALAKRVFQIEAIVTKEMSGLKESIDNTITALQIREDNKAVSYQQQSMEHTNNLALLLDDIIQQMQMQMQSQGGQQSANDQQASPSEMQKSINQKTQQLSDGQKSGRELAEGLAEIAAEQARLRKLTDELLKNSDDGSKPGGDGISDIIKEMEAIEESLVNKRLNTELINRQERLVTKLLEAENASNEQEEENEREAQTAKNYTDKRTPRIIEEYLNKRKTEIEQLNATPPSLSPYYKDALVEYYKRIKSENN
jgi:hypothetical protein